MQKEKPAAPAHVESENQNKLRGRVRPARLAPGLQPGIRFMRAVTGTTP